MYDRLKAIWRKHDAAIITYMGIGVIVIAGALGFYFVYGNESGGMAGCTSEIVSLSPPTNPTLVLDAVNMLIEEGVIPNLEAAENSIRDAQYIFDPDDEELEYWLLFQQASGMVVAEFDFSCPLDEEGYPLDLRYDGSRGL